MWSLLVYILGSLLAVSAHGPIVRVAQGQLRGSTMKSVEGKKFHAFRGIPFAMPPLGNLRFRAPVPADSWEGTRNATEDGPPCSQLDERFGPPSEDCLTLNVYTPQLPNAKGGRLRPVMVFFHPGGFFAYTGNSIFAGPQYLMDQDIVFVAGNYRLGALGFLSTQDAHLPGNYGMKDQVLLLRWVKENIAAFGGDPSQVTISGYSAGSVSVMMHMLSPMSQGLFHRCIASSASAFPAVDSKRMVGYAKKLGQLMNCTTDSSEEMADCLRTKSAESLAATLGQFREFAYDPIAVFYPTVEQGVPAGEEPFLPDDTTKLALEGRFAHVPLLTGHTTLEFAWKSLEILLNVNWTRQLNEDFERYAPIIFSFERDTDRSREISRELRKFYFNNQPISNATEVELGQLYADSNINFAQRRAAELFSRRNKALVYFYKFSYEGSWSYVYYPTENQTYGTVHHDDLIYLMLNSAQFPLMTPQDREYSMMKKMTTMWANFVKEGNPTPRKTQLLNKVKWEPFTTSNPKYLDINEPMVMKRGLYEERMDLWKTLLPIPELDTK